WRSRSGFASAGFATGSGATGFAGGDGAPAQPSRHRMSAVNLDLRATSIRLATRRPVSRSAHFVATFTAEFPSQRNTLGGAVSRSRLSIVRPFPQEMQMKTMLRVAIAMVGMTSVALAQPKAPDAKMAPTAKPPDMK